MLSTKVSEKSVGKMKPMRLLAVFLVPVSALIMGATATEGWAQPECFFNIEFNATDLDVGVRGFFDYEPWKELEIENPVGRTIAEVDAKRSLALQGFAEWFFESGEPMLGEDGFTFPVFLERFPEGDYTFEAETINPDEVECVAEFTHAIPCPPETSLVGRVIRWDDAETVVDPDQTPNAADEVECVDPHILDIEDYEIDGYEVIVEGLRRGEDTEFSVILPANADRVSVPREVGRITKYEVLRIEASGNQTITEEEL